MAQKPTSRRSGSTRKPVTIDLEANAVEASSETTGTTPEAEPVGFENSQTARGPADNLAEATEAAAEKTETSSGEDAEARDAVEGGDPQSSASEEPVSAPPPGASRSGSGLAWLGGGVIGGLVALLLAGGLQWAGVLPSMRSAEPVDLSPMQGRIDDLAAEIESVRGAAPEVPGDLTARMETLESAMAATGQTTDSLQGELASANAEITALKQAVSSGGAGEGAGLEALASRAAALETAIADIGGRIDGLETGGGSEVGEALRGELDAVSQMAQSANDDVSALRGEVDSMSSALSETQSGIAAFQERLSGVESDIEAGAGSRVAAAIAASALKSAADRGAGFMSELEAYASVSNDQDTVAALRDYAAAGVPTQAQLSERFPAVANRIVAASRGVGESAGIIDRLSASARSLVQVRPVGEVEGDDPGAVTARMEVALKSGNLGRVVAEWETLPEAAQDASADFIADVRARSELDTLIARVLSGAMTQNQNETGE